MSLAKVLADHNRHRFTPTLPGDDWKQQLDNDRQVSEQEILWVESLRADIQSQTAQVPRDADGFLRWFEALKENGPGQGDKLFPWLEKKATLDQMRWFIFQEVAGEAGFEDLVALTQVRIETRPKLEMARNYWDEMGRGAEVGMHGPMLGRTAEELRIAEMKAEFVHASLDLANLLSALAYHRRYTYQSIGALGAVELTAPGRTGLVAKGLKRLGISKEGAQYFVLHSGLDVKHSIAWNAEVLRPLVESDPRLAPALAEGALMRLRAGEKCFQAYRAHFALEGAEF